MANSPQLSVFGEGRTPEAYVPLPDGKNIPVKMAGGGGGTYNITVRVESLDPERADQVVAKSLPMIRAQIAASLSSGEDRKLSKAVAGAR